MLLSILHALTRDAVLSFYVRIWKKKLTQSLCKLTEKCFSYIINELLNWYWWILALVGFKMHSQARAFSQPPRANIHQYQFNNPIALISEQMFNFTVIFLFHRLGIYFASLKYILDHARYISSCLLKIKVSQSYYFHLFVSLILYILSLSLSLSLSHSLSL